MSLFRLLSKGAKEAIQEQSAKQELEQKLGRKVSREELYSLGSHLDAAGADNISKPLKVTARETKTPFADAKPPMEFTTKLLLIGITLLLFVVFIGGFFMANMSERTYNRLNPFSPKPPEGTFPANLGNYTLDHKPDYNAPTSYTPTKSFSAEYKNGTETIRYTVFVYNNEAELNEAFDKRRNSVVKSDKSKVVDNSENRYMIAALSGWNNYIYFKDGIYLKQIDAFRQNPALEFEGLLKNTAPLPVTPLNEVELKNSSDSNSQTVTVLQLLDEYKKDSAAADTKYKGKTITISGTVEVSDKDKKGNWMIGFMRPGSTKPTEGMVICSFEKAQESSVSKVKKGDSVILQGKVSMELVGSVMLEKCIKK